MGDKNIKISDLQEIRHIENAAFFLVTEEDNSSGEIKYKSKRISYNNLSNDVSANVYEEVSKRVVYLGEISSNVKTLSTGLSALQISVQNNHDEFLSSVSPGNCKISSIFKDYDEEDYGTVHSYISSVSAAANDMITELRNDTSEITALEDLSNDIVNIKSKLSTLNTGTIDYISVNVDEISGNVNDISNYIYDGISEDDYDNISEQIDQQIDDKLEDIEIPSITGLSNTVKTLSSYVYTGVDPAELTTMSAQIDKQIDDKLKIVEILELKIARHEPITLNEGLNIVSCDLNNKFGTYDDIVSIRGISCSNENALVIGHYMDASALHMTLSASDNLENVTCYLSAYMLKRYKMRG